MRKAFALAVVSALALACGDGEQSEAGCSSPDGTYLLTYTERRNQCGLGKRETVLYFDGTRQSLEALAPDCTGVRSVSSDGCSVSMNQRCAARSPSGVVIGYSTLAGTLNFVNDREIEGQASMTIEEVNGWLCSSTFDMVGRKQ